MKKLLLVTTFAGFLFQLPVCPYRYIPEGWVSSFEFGRKFFSLWLDASTISVEEEKKETMKAAISGNFPSLSGNALNEQKPCSGKF